jgi:hypothetical protein
MRAPARPRRGELREQMGGVASVIACLVYGSNDRKLAAISAALSYYRTPENNGITSSSKAHACPNLYPKAIEN